MQQIFSLPKISIKDLESRVRDQRATHQKYNREDRGMENNGNHHGDIKITSPFY